MSLWLGKQTMCMHAKSLQPCLTLCNPMNCSPPGSLSMGFSRQEYWSGFQCPPPGDLPNPGIEPASLMSLALAGRFFITGTTWEALSRANFSVIYRRPLGRCSSKYGAWLINPDWYQFQPPLKAGAHKLLKSVPTSPIPKIQTHLLESPFKFTEVYSSTKIMT